MDQICLKRYFQSRAEKVNIIIEFHIFKLVLVPKFSWNWQFWFFGLNLPKKIFPVKNRKSEYHHGIFHIWISLGTKFEPKQTILCIWTKLTQKRYFQSKTEQGVQELQAFSFYVANVNSAVVFKHFKDLKSLLILKI